MPEGTANPAPRWIAAAVAIAAAAWFGYAGLRHAVASHYAASTNPENWLRATRIEPNNAEIWYQLGRYRQLDFDNSDIPLAITYYRRAEQLNPRSPYYKLDLASALEMSGDVTAADGEFRAARDAYPVSGEVAWKYGNFLLRQNRLPEAKTEIHKAILADPTLLPLAVSRIWHSDPDIHGLLDEVLPDTVEAYQAALSYLSDAQEPDAALEAWRRLIAKDPRTNIKTSFKLVDMLVAQEKYDEAQTVWRQAVACDPGETPGYAGNSLVFDGGFEKEISGGGFGWRLNDVKGAEFDFDMDEKHSGSRSAQLTFDGASNLSYEDLFQYIVVSPGTRYHFQGFLRTDGISSESGMRFEIVDLKDAQRLDVLTTNETGAVPWTLEQADFTTGPNTHVITIRVARRPSVRLDNKLRGSVWIDDVSLTPAAADGAAAGAAKH